MYAITILVNFFRKFLIWTIKRISDFIRTKRDFLNPCERNRF
jgi:hypothetical protein